MEDIWKSSIRLEKTPGAPLYRQVAGSVVERVSKGLLAPGAPLPGTRSLAKSLGVHRNTVKAAYDELLAQGWIRTAPSRGTFVATLLPVRRAGFRGLRALDGSGPAFLNHPPPAVQAFVDTEGASAGLPYRQTLVFTDGLPDARLAPIAELSRAMRRALKSPKTWAAQDGWSHFGLRSHVAEMLRGSRAIPATPEEILITCGQRMSLHLIATALLPEGAVVAVEQPGNKAAWEVFTRCGLRVVGVPVDAQGICVERLATHTDIAAVYVTPAHQYPTTVRMSVERREQILAWSHSSGALIIEDDQDSEFEFDNAALFPLAAMDPAAAIVHMAPYSRIFSPVAEPGYVRASRGVIGRLNRARAILSRCDDRMMESALFDLAAEGVLRRHRRRVQDHYRERRDRMALCLKRELGNRLKVAIPGGGLAMWIQAGGVDTYRWAASARRLGVRFTPSAEYLLKEDSRGGIRLGFAALTTDESATAIAVLQRSLLNSSEKHAREMRKECSEFRRCIA